MAGYNKIILLSFMILPLFTGSLAVGGLQTAYGGGDQECTDDDGCAGGSECRIAKCVGTTCQIVDAAEGVTCGDQSSEGVCDNPDTCNGTGKCRENNEPNTTECRAAEGVCDVAETCSGFSVDCPDDGFVAGGAVCRPSGGTCDVAETCTGDSAVCPDDGFSTDLCRPSSGVCDVEEFCDGSSASCPDDAFADAGTACTCSAGPGICDGDNVCNADISIDIKPGSDPNSINPKKMGLVPVAILGSETFDVLDVDYANVLFGTGGAMPVHMGLEDVNGDGFIDLVLLYSQKETGIVKGDTEACISGALFDGTPIEACDAIKTPGK